MWDEIIYPVQKRQRNNETAEVWEWIYNFIQHFTGHVITYPRWD